jgi:hypothetical protein
MIPSPVNNEFMGVIEHVMEFFYDLLAEEPESPSGSNSSRGSHHPSRECFMTSILEGHVESIYEEEATPANDLDDEADGETAAPPCIRVEPNTERSRKRNSSSSRNAQSSIGRSNATETVGAHVPWLTT